MKLNFPWDEVERLMREVQSAKTARPLYDEKTGKGLWLVGDQGVYLMPNTSDGPLMLAAKGTGKNLVAYAKECDPTKLQFDDWYETKRQAFGGDDGVEFIPLENIEKRFAQRGKSKAFQIVLSPSQLSY